MIKIPHFKKGLFNFQLPRVADFRTISDKAHHDWKIIMTLFIFFAFATIVGNYVLFEEVDKGTIFSETPTEELNADADVVSKKNLEDTVQFFKEREARLKDLETLKPSVPDPSV